jgi:hypothetical protein
VLPVQAELLERGLSSVDGMRKIIEGLLNDGDLHVYIASLTQTT